MNNEMKKLEISHQDLELIERALETQTKILRMQASAGGHGAAARLNEVKRLSATISGQRDAPRPVRKPQGGLWGLLRSMGPAI